MPINASQIFAFSSELRRAPQRVGRSVAAAVRSSGRDLQQAARAAAPARTGRLRNSIKVDVEGSGRGGSISARVSTDLPYAAYVEYGTSRQAPEPFMRPATDGIEDQFYGAVEAALDEGMAG